MATTIWIKERTKDMLDKIGNKGETYDDIIRRLILGVPLNLSKRWYRQGVQAVPYFIYIPVRKVIERVGDGFGYNRGLNNYDYWDHQATIVEARKVLYRHMKEGDYIDRLIREWRSIIDEQIRYEKEIKPNMDNPYKILKTMISTIERSWEIAITIELFDADPDGLIGEILDKYSEVSMSLKEFKNMCSPETSIIKKELVDFYDACLNGRLKEHQKKYFWIRNTWSSTIYLDVNYFMERKKRMIEEGVNFKEELKKMRVSEKKNIRGKTGGRIGKAIDLFRKLAEWREKRKKTSMVTNYYMEVLLENFLKEYRIKKDIGLFALPEEYMEKRINAEELKERSKVHVFYIDDKPRFISGKRAESFIEELKMSERNEGARLYGTIANPGKVEGRAKVVFTIDDIKKFRKGDIMVAPATRPEYLPAMRKAKAIITDEGGITSHAAIVSRELGVPCIVGLFNATDVIRDGDVIFVNANHGIVEKKI